MTAVSLPLALTPTLSPIPPYPLPSLPPILLYSLIHSTLLHTHSLSFPSTRSLLCARLNDAHTERRCRPIPRRGVAWLIGLMPTHSALPSSLLPLPYDYRASLGSTVCTGRWFVMYLCPHYEI